MHGLSRKDEAFSRLVRGATRKAFSNVVDLAIEEGAAFYPAEDYHKDYYERNGGQGYCQVVIAPKLQKVQKEYAELLKTV